MLTTQSIWESKDFGERIVSKLSPTYPELKMQRMNFWVAQKYRLEIVQRALQLGINILHPKYPSPTYFCRHSSLVAEIFETNIRDKYRRREYVGGRFLTLEKSLTWLSCQQRECYQITFLVKQFCGPNSKFKNNGVTWSQKIPCRPYDMIHVKMSIWKKSTQKIRPNRTESNLFQFIKNRMSNLDSN